MTIAAAEPIPRISFVERNRNLLLGLLSVALFLGAWQALFLFVPLNPLFISKPSLIAESLYELIVTGTLLHDLAVSAVPFAYGFGAAIVVGIVVGIVMGWRVRVGYALDPIMTVFYASATRGLA
jgi:NitT/TauT family transport system permease protein